MRKWIMIGIAAASLAGCGNKKCDQLKTKLCEGLDEATCKGVKAWFDSEMTGPDGKKLSADEAEMGCGLILDDKQALDAYKQQASKHTK